MKDKVIKTENGIERAIVSDEEFKKGLSYGKPRRGHPEGQVIYHVLEVLENVEKYCNEENRSQLRLIALVHDTFKHQVDRSQPRIGDNHHSRLARKFAEKFIQDKDVLKVIEFHDDAFNAWQKGANKGDWGKAKSRAMDLIRKLGDSIDLYMAFYKCDNATGDKETDNFIWFEEIVESNVF